MPTIINGTTGIDKVQDGTITADDIVSGVIPTGFGFKNRIINGAMMIDQRNAGASVTPTNGQYSVDRWFGFLSQASKFSVQQNSGSVTPPAGFVNYLGAVSLSSYSVGVSETFGIAQRIEGFNVADLGWGTANAKTVTLSFWVRSSLTGTFGGSLRNSAQNRSYPFSYTINSADTWELETITIAGDTTGTWLTDNSTGIRVSFSLGAGSNASGTAGAWASANYTSATGATSVVGTSGATFYITGVQLEKGSTATSFDYRPYGNELALCQRYLPAYSGSSVRFIGQAYASNALLSTVYFPVQTRVAPTGISISSTSHFGAWNSGTSGAGTPSAIVFNNASVLTGNVGVEGLSSANLVAGNATALVFVNSAAQILFTGCEL
jgi:hypothetical protein